MLFPVPSPALPLSRLPPPRFLEPADLQIVRYNRFEPKIDIIEENPQNEGPSAYHNLMGCELRIVN